MSVEAPPAAAIGGWGRLMGRHHGDADRYLVVTGDGIVGALDALVQRALAVEF